MKINRKRIKALKPCADGYEWYLEHGSEDLEQTLLALNSKNPDWARWLFIHLMNEAQRRCIAVFAAEQVLPFFESRFPGDKRPRAAIDAAKAALENDAPRTRITVVSAAADVADAAYVAADAAYVTAKATAAAAAHVAYAAAYAAYSAAHAAHAAQAAHAAHAAHAPHAAYAAAYAAAQAAAHTAISAAAHTAYAAGAADAVRKEMQERIIREAVWILDEKGDKT